ncbi:unnamed protein product [Pleuronectes platessa]|uniref:Uncharacterized protein n=1 Tax=Pleuronectes platessa TaxID=8262 RepID=A0A9N7ZAF1_PLEPL|nr:unnamed protein product [Pleuronectes platessa]
MHSTWTRTTDTAPATGGGGGTDLQEARASERSREEGKSQAEHVIGENDSALAVAFRARVMETRSGRPR